MENLCTLSEISLDVMGNCQECVYVSLDESVLQPARDRLLQQYDA